MDEPELFNHTPFHVSVLPILDRDGAQARVVIVKASYTITTGGALELAEQQREVREGDEPWNLPEIPDVRLPGDLCAAKPGTDFILSGYAVPPAGRRDSYVDVNLRVADRTKTLRVHGRRVWYRSALGVTPGPASPVQPTPLAWSGAYGGLDLSDPARPIEDSRNPVGSGVARNVDQLIGTAAPQIEAPDEPITVANGDFVPVGCAPLGRNFEPRRRTMGTYDSAWLDAIYPARPADYREEHENCAPPDFVFRDPLRGGEPITATGVHPTQPLAFRLPKHRIVISAEIDGTAIERRPHLDTVVLDSSALLLELVWRALFRCPAKMHDRFTGVVVQSKEFTE